jgi:hypothetical protein
MKPFALITTDPLEFVRGMDSMPNKVKDGYAVVPQVQADAPTYDPATQKLELSRIVSASAVTHGFVVAALSNQELIAIQRNSQQESERPNVTNWINTLRQGNATNLQTQRALAWVIRELTGQ